MPNDIPINPIANPQAQINALHQHLLNQQPNALEAALPILNANPKSPDVMLMTIMAALSDQRPEHALRYLQRFNKTWRQSGGEADLLRAIALAQQDHWMQAAQVAQQVGWQNFYAAFTHLPGSWNWRNWAHGWAQKIETAEFKRIRAAQLAERAAAKAAIKQAAPVKKGASKATKKKKAVAVEAEPLVEETPLSDLPRYDLRP